MSAYLLTWNPARWKWADLNKIILLLASGDTAPIRWSCGNNRAIPLGARVFLLRQGIEPKGIVASGWVTSTPFEAPHYDDSRAAAGDMANYVEFSPDVVIDTEVSAPLDAGKLKSPALMAMHWSTQVSGITIPEAAASELARLWMLHTDHAITVGEYATELEATEGELRFHLVAHRSRERTLRDAKVAAFIATSQDGRLRCEVPNCGFDFSAVYGSIGDGYAQVHHLRPLADADGVSQTRLQDLAVVCANCHAMIHRGGGCRPLDSLIR